MLNLCRELFVETRVEGVLIPRKDADEPSVVVDGKPHFVKSWNPEQKLALVSETTRQVEEKTGIFGKHEVVSVGRIAWTQ
ncbi:MAG: hypothetical protein AAB428_03480 [Patescibacteria group bacterium]